MKKSNTQNLVKVAMLAAIGYLLMFLAFPVIPAFSFMKVDFSEIPILIGTFIMGPVAGALIALIRSLLHLLTTGTDLGNIVGNAASFLAAMCYVLPIYYLSQRKRTKGQLGVSLLSGTLLMTLFMSVANYFVITPLYMLVLNFPLGMPLEKYVLFGVVPFNLIKGVLVSSVFALVYSRMMPWLTRKEQEQKLIQTTSKHH